MIRSNYSDEDTKDEERNELSRQRMTVTGLTDIVGVHHTNSVPPVLTMTARTLVVLLEWYSWYFDSAKLSVLSDNFAVPLGSVRQTPVKLRPTRLHLPRRTPGSTSSTVPSSPLPPLATIDPSTSPDHLFQTELGWSGTCPRLDRLHIVLRLFHSCFRFMQCLRSLTLHS